MNANRGDIDQRILVKRERRQVLREDLSRHRAQTEPHNYVRAGELASGASGNFFHRVVAGFIAQAGGYTPDMQPKAVTENVVNESGNGLSNLRGTVGFARSNEPHSGTSQFYINLSDNVDLNPRPTRWGYAVFGKIVDDKDKDDGMRIVDEIGHRPTGAGGPFDKNVPVEPITIETIELLQ